MAEIIDCYCANNCDYLNLKRLVEQLNNFNSEYASTFNSLINLVILIELQRDIAGLDNIVQSGRVITVSVVVLFAVINLHLHL